MDVQETATDDHALGLISESDLASIADASNPFVGDWHQLVSTTNWGKGRIIQKWREQLADSGAAPRLYSDPAWSRLVGEVSSQHVGRLRRTYQRFGDVHEDYDGLFWSHFYAALDWHDAEMWLEGAVQNRWSVSKMRFQRWEATGGTKEDRPKASEIVASDDDEGLALIQVPSGTGSEGQESADDLRRGGNTEVLSGPAPEGPDFGEEENGSATRSASATRVDVEEILDNIPSATADAFRAFREAIEQHKAADWQEVTRMQVIALINDLKRILRNDPG